MNLSELINSQSAKSCHPWIDSSRFETLNQAEVLNGVLTSVMEAVAARIRNGGQPVKVIFDLDSTIFDVKPRSLRILKEFGLSKEAKALNPKLAEWSLGLNAHKLLYTLEESAHANGVEGSEEELKTYFKAAFAYWRDRFFTHAYLTVDQPTPGAVEYAHRVVDLGATAVYLTGRDWPGMGKGTRSMLEYCGFPMDPNHSELIMKPHASLDDSDFKDEALRELRTTSNAVALFDNEPANFHVFEKNFPDAWLVFYHSNCSTKEARTVKRLYKIENFLIP
jgi:hypothetical protein